MRRPSTVNLNATSVGIINSITRTEGGYLAGAPLAENTTQSIRQVGQFINATQERQNQFLSALVNRIALVIISSKFYSNPWAFAKKGIIEDGETVEEIFNAIIDAEQYVPDNGTQTTQEILEAEFKVRKPNVLAAYHVMNYQKMYPVSVSYEQMKAAFVTRTALTNLISRIVGTIYSSANYDEFLALKYVLYRLALDGTLPVVNVPAPTKDNADDIMINIKYVSDEMTFMKKSYNIARVETYTDKENQMLIFSTKSSSTIDVAALASAYNLDKIEFAGRQILMDSFTQDEVDRLNVLFADDPTYEPLTVTDISNIGNIVCFLIDKDMPMLIDNLNMTTYTYLASKMRWTYFYHKWLTLSASPFKNCVCFVSGTNEVTGITLNPPTATVNKGSTVQFIANVQATGIADTSVTWEISGDGIASTIDQNGLVTIGAGETAQSLTVTATSNAYPDVSGDATITVSGN